MIRKRSVGRRVRPLLALALSLLVKDASAVRISVKGSTTIEARVVPDSNGPIIRGTVRDDVGAPVLGALVSVQVIGLDGAPVLALPQPLPCENSPEVPFPKSHAGEYLLDADASGEFCARVPNFPTRGVLKVSFSGRDALSRSSLEATFDVDRPSQRLSWDPPPEQIDLDLPHAKVSVSAGSQDEKGAPLMDLALVLRDERGKELSRSTTDDRGHATFDIDTSLLADAGPGELEVRPADPTRRVAAIREKIIRTARVQLTGQAPGEAFVARDGQRFELEVKTSRGVADSGVVEARIGSDIVGAGAVREGRAQVVTTFDVPEALQLDLTFDYLPASPALRAHEPLTLRVTAKPPSLWRRAPLLLVGLLLLGWLARGWRRAPRVEREPDAAAGMAGQREAPLPEMSEQLDASTGGWTGVVLDAHDRAPIAGAVVTVVARDFVGERKLAEHTTGADGRFSFTFAAAPQQTLVVEAPLHARIERALPRHGRLRIALTSRRRLLIDRLLTTARRMGLWPSVTEPTPGQLAEVFEEQQRAGAAQWAKAVERAAFGHRPIDAEEEAKVVSLESNLTRHEPDERVGR